MGSHLSDESIISYISCCSTTEFRAHLKKRGFFKLFYKPELSENAVIIRIFTSVHTCTKSSGPLVRYGNFTLKLWNIAILIRVIVVNVAAKFLQRTYFILLIPYNKRHRIKFFNFPIIYCVLEIPSTIVWLSL